MITKIAPDGPAFRTQQIQVGDLLVQVDDYLLDGMKIDEVRRCITGPPHSDIYLNLLRPLMNAETGIEELNPIHVNMKRERSSSSKSSFHDRDVSPSRYDGQQNSYGSGNGPRMPKDFFPQPIVGQAYSQFTPSMLQVLLTIPMHSKNAVAIWSLDGRLFKFSHCYFILAYLPPYAMHIMSSFCTVPIFCRRPVIF